VAVDALISERSASEIMRSVAGVAITGAVFFSVAWHLSSFLTSPTFAVAGSLLAAYLLVLVSALICYLAGLDLDVYVPRVYCGLCLVTAPICFALGTWHYLRRVEP
jgi:hypothetical protein